jgi:hypothetical protein
VLERRGVKVVALSPLMHAEVWAVSPLNANRQMDTIGSWLVPSAYAWWIKGIQKVYISMYVSMPA